MFRFMTTGVIVLALLLSGCKISGNSTTTTQANFRVLHVASGLGPVSLTVDQASSPNFIGLAFSNASNYLGFNAGVVHDYVLSLTATPSTLLDVKYTLSGDNRYTLVLYGVSGATAGLLLQDTAPQSPASGYFQFRPVHTALQAGSLDFYITAVGADINTASPNFNSLTIGNTPTFAQFLAGDYQLRITPVSTKTVVYDSGKITYAAGGTVTADIYTTGSANLVNLQMMYQDSNNTVVSQTNLLSQFKATNASPDSGAFNFLVDGTAKLSNVPYKGTSSYLQSAAGTRNLNAQSVLTGVSVAGAAVNFAGGNDYSVVAVGNAGAVSLLVLQDSNIAPSLFNSRLRVVNASTNAAAIDVQVNYITYVSALAKNTASSYLQFAPNTSPGYTVSVSLTGSSAPALTIPSVFLNAARTYTIYVVGNSSALDGVVALDN